jgi:hypothetical protein
MTTEQKTEAIRQIVRNHEENMAATNAAHVPTGLEGLVIQARNHALIAELQKVFAVPGDGGTLTLGAAGATSRRARGKSSV